MPYASKRALPAAVKKLPSHAQSIFRKAFNSAFSSTEEEERAFKIAWAAVKRSYTKKEGRWMAKTKDAFPPAEEEEEAPDVCNEDSPDYDEEACAALQEETEDAFPPAEEEEGDVCDEDDPAYDEEACAAKQDKKTGDSGVRSWVDTYQIDRGNMRMTANGYLVAQARVARTGIQIYSGDEVGDDRPTVRVYRPEETVFDSKSLHSFAHKPVTVGHPPEMVNAHNWRDYAVGHVDGEIVRDGDMVKVPMMITDATAIQAINNGASQLSVGYDARLEMIDGKTEAGEVYDAIQHDIRVNHIALTPSARGGPKLRIGDRKEKSMDRATLSRTVTIDGIEIKLAEPNVSIVQRGLKKLRDQVVSLTQERDTLTGKVAALNKQVKDAKFTDADLDKRVAERQVLVSQAQRVLGDAWQPDGKSAGDIRREVVANKLGDEIATGMSDAGITGAFTAVTATDASGGTRELALALAKPGHGSSGSKPNAEQAWEERGKQMREAWKVNNGSQVRQ